MSFWGELRRRNVVKVGAAYAIVAWLLIQIADTLLPAFGAPAWVMPVFSSIVFLGFPLALILAWVFEVTPEGLKKSSSDDPALSTSGTAGQRLNYVIIGALVIAVGLLWFDDYSPERPVPEAPVQNASITAVPEASETPELAASTAERDVLPNSIAVLLCDNFSTDPENGFFAASLHEEMLNQLVKLRNLNVIARTSVLQYADTQTPITDIARELRVESVMECSVAYGEGRIVISAQLIDGNTGLHIWSDRYNREFADVFGIQADIAMNVANALQAEFSSDEQAAIEAPPTSSSAAYGLYLQARSAFGAGAGNSAAGIHELLDRALALDPDFASALALKATVYVAELINTTGVYQADPRGQARLEPLIRDYAARAQRANPEDADGFAPLAALAAFTWRWNEAEPLAVRVLDARSIGNQAVNWFISWTGDHERSIEYAERNAILNPAFWQQPWNLGIVLNYAGRYDESAAALQRAIEMAPQVPVHRSWLAYSEIARGNYDAAFREFQLIEQLIGDQRAVLFLLDLAYGYSRIGDQENAQRLYDEIEAVAANLEIGAGGWAIASLAIGDYDDALRWLNIAAEKASRHELDAGMFNLMNLKLNYTNDPVLDRPEFIEVRNRLRGD